MCSVGQEPALRLSAQHTAEAGQARELTVLVSEARGCFDVNKVHRQKCVIYGTRLSKYFESQHKFTMIIQWDLPF